MNVKPSEMPCLSVRQPWASFIVEGIKDVENRTWYTSYKGPVFIHASKTFTKEDYDIGKALYFQINKDNPGAVCPFPEKEDKNFFPLGGIIGMANIIDCAWINTSPWFFGPYGFYFSNPVRIPFVPCKGRLKFFPVPEEAKVFIDEWEAKK